MISAKNRSWVARDPDPSDPAVFHMAPVGDRQWACGGSSQLKSGQHVRSVNPAMDHLHMSGYREHATQPAEGLRDAMGFGFAHRMAAFGGDDLAEFGEQDRGGGGGSVIA